jgi:alkylhydroperoxidase family enzyme
VNALVARVIGVATGGRPPNVMTTLALHRGLFRPWLRFAGKLMPGGLLPRAESELLILRTAHNCGSEYEWGQHERLARAAGLSDEEIARVREGADAAGWSERQALLLRACDELHADRKVSEATWAGLRPMLKDAELIEVCMLVGHYAMLAGTLNSLEVVPDAPPAGRPPRIMRVFERLTRGRR